MAVFDLSLEQVVTGPVGQLKTSNLEHCPKGLLLQNAAVLEATDVDQGRSSGADTDLCDSWLRDMSPLLSAWDCKLLRRYIPSLSTDSLQKVMTVSNSERITALANRREQSQLCVAEQQISKMAMRRVLETTFARLASADTDIQEVYRHWQATDHKTNRKSKASTAQSAWQYKQRAQNRSG